MRLQDAHSVALLLAQSPVFGLLDSAERQRLVERCRVDRFDVRSLLCGASDAPDRLWLVLEGQIELTAGSIGGDEVTLSIIGAGGWASWLALFHDDGAGHGFYASPRARIASWDSNFIRQQIDRHPALYPALIGEIGTRFRALIDWVEHASLAPGPQRLAKLLLLLASSGGDGKTVQLSQERLARLANCSRQTLHDRLRQLRTAGLIEQHYGAIHICDRQRLIAAGNAA